MHVSGYRKHRRTIPSGACHIFASTYDAARRHSECNRVARDHPPYQIMCRAIKSLVDPNARDNANTVVISASSAFQKSKSSVENRTPPRCVEKFESLDPRIKIYFSSLISVCVMLARFREERSPESVCPQ